MKVIRGIWSEFLEFIHDPDETYSMKAMGVGLLVLLIGCALLLIGLGIWGIYSIWWDLTHTCTMYSAPYMVTYKGSSYMTRDCIQWTK